MNNSREEWKDDLAVAFGYEEAMEEKKLFEERIVAQTKEDDMLLESHSIVISETDKLVVSERSWSLFQLIYEYIGGFHSYESFREMAETAEMFRFTYSGKLDNIEDFEVEKCLAIGTYNRNYGLKMTAIATNFICFDKRMAKAAARKLQRDSFRNSWLECSGRAEKFIIDCGGMNYLISPSVIKEKIYLDREIVLDVDDVHYYRILTATGKYVRKMACGTIKL